MSENRRPAKVTSPFRCTTVLPLLAAAALSGACGGESREESTSSRELGLTGIICDVERAAEIAEMACGYLRRRCETLAGCCSAAGYSGSVEDCSSKNIALCERDVRAFLETGSCFDVDRFDPSCDDRLMAYDASCRQAPVLTAAFREDYTERCPSPWTKGNLSYGSTCIMYSQQCAEPDEETVTYCFPRFDAGSSVPQCRSFIRRHEGEECSELDSCVDGTSCSSSDVCEFRKANGAACVDGFSDCDSGACVNGLCVDFVGLPCEQGCGNGTCGADGRCEEFPLANEASCNFELERTMP